ncbi:ADP-ribosylation factor 5 [Columba livia]|uniref:ADP-ribosylation factor 5 n=1 Tax=Columba livia TaxID=8932 RepID=A0A2I0LKG9_COLLI|nr:ADP-ribosylation factor 5 [Columba livia]
MGRGRPGQNPASLETLLSKHAGSHLRGGQQRPRAGAGVCRGAAEDAAGGRAARRRPAGVRQQAGHAQRHGGERADRQAGAAGAAQPHLVRAGDVRDAGHGAVRRAGLAVARALQALAEPDERGHLSQLLFSWPRLCVFIW